jgi:hypothetical protein
MLTSSSGNCTEVRNSFNQIIPYPLNNGFTQARKIGIMEAGTLPDPCLQKFIVGYHTIYKLTL